MKSVVIYLSGEDGTVSLNVKIRDFKGAGTLRQRMVAREN